MRARAKLIALITAILSLFVFSAVPLSAAGRAKKEYYSDKPAVLSDDTKKYITERNYNLEANCDGAQVYVLITDTTGYDDIGDYAASRFNELGLGKSGVDNGVLIFLAIEDDDYWISFGSGLEKVFTSERLVSIIAKGMEPNFAKKQYDKAVYETFKLINKDICDLYGADANASVPGILQMFNYGNDYRPAYESLTGCGGCSGCGSCISCASCGVFSLIACVGCELLSSFGGEG